MELDNLKSNWKETSVTKKSKNELLMMTKVNNHPKLKRVRIKFFIEVTLLLVFAFVYFDGFDGDKKPLWANIVLVLAIVAYIAIRAIGLYLLRNPVQGNDLKVSLRIFENKIKRISLLSIATSLLFGITVILFFSSSINFTKEKYVILIVMIVMLLGAILFSHKNWKSRIKSISTALEGFEQN